jgi:polyisoprenoid-binding protein YceI
MQARKAVLLCVGAAVLIAGAVAMRVQSHAEPVHDTIVFAGLQAGARFEGEFRKFVADVDFDPEHLAQSHFDVTIDMQSVDSKDEERDATMRGPDLFAASSFPTAHYVANTFSDEGGGKYRAAGKLTLRDVTHEIPVEFTYEKNESGAWIKGGALLKRLDFGVGQGDWQSTTMVANEVEVRFAIKVDMSDDVS